MNVKHKNYKEDFTLLVSLGTGYNGEQFKFIFTTKGTASLGVAKYECSYLNGVYKNCEKTDATHVLLKFDNYNLPTGLLVAEKTFYIPNASMPDGYLNLHEKGVAVFTDSDNTEYHLELVTGESDTFTLSEMTITMLKALVKGDKGDAFTYADFTAAQIADLKKPATDAAAAITARADAGEFNGKDGSLYFPTVRVDAGGYLVVEVPDGDDTNMSIDDEGYLCVGYPDIN